jgi:flagellar motor switch protein FliN/FliY
MSPEDIGGALEPAAVMARAAKGLASELAAALAAALNRKVKPGAVEVVQISEAELPDRMGGRAAAFCIELTGACRGIIAVVFSAEATGALAGLVKGLKGAKLAAKAAGDFDYSDIEELGNTVAGALGGLGDRLSEAIEDRLELVLSDTLSLPAGEADELVRLVGLGPYPIASFDLVVQPKTRGHALIVFPSSFAGVPEIGGHVMRTAGGGIYSVTPQSRVIADLHPNIRRILRLTMPVSVVVAEKEMTVDTCMRLTPGAIVEFNKSADQDLDLYVNHHKVGSGEVVTIGERFGIQLRHIEGLEQRIRKLGAARPAG